MLKRQTIISSGFFSGSTKRDLSGIVKTSESDTKSVYFKFGDENSPEKVAESEVEEFFDRRLCLQVDEKLNFSEKPIINSNELDLVCFSQEELNLLSQEKLNLDRTHLSPLSNLSHRSMSMDELTPHSRESQEELNQDPIHVSPLFNVSPRSMPISPHGVIEEGFKHNPWAMLVATIFLTKTTARAAKPFMRKFFEDFPTPHDVLDVHPNELEQYFEMLGLRKRSHMIWRMTYQFVSAKWRRASDLCGIGKYGEDAYRIFCLGHTDVEPTDRYLKLYLDWLKTRTDHLEELSNSDCECLIVDPVSVYYSISLK